MVSVRTVVRTTALAAGTVLLATSACTMAPIAFHDGLPAWTPETGKTEVSAGYNRMFWSLERGSTGYLTPGVRVGLGTGSNGVDIGLTSVVASGGGVTSAYLGPTLGFGYQQPNFSLMLRPSMYLLTISNYGSGFAFGWYQLGLLVGNGNKAGRLHFAAGGRLSPIGIGPLLMVGKDLGPVDLRAEASYMLPRVHDGVEGELLSVGLTIGGPVRHEPGEPSGGEE